MFLTRLNVCSRAPQSNFWMSCLWIRNMVSNIWEERKKNFLLSLSLSLSFSFSFWCNKDYHWVTICFYYFFDTSKCDVWSGAIDIWSIFLAGQNTINFRTHFYSNSETRSSDMICKRNRLTEWIFNKMMKLLFI